MKKVFAIFLALLIGLSVSAQIQNKILGFTLGTSTKNEVKNKYKYHQNFREEDRDIFINFVEFAGNDWDFVHFHFYKNKLASVDFSNIAPYTSPQILESRWSNLRDRLYNKYSAYYVNMNGSMLLFSDDVTNVALKLSDETGSLMLMLYYSNDYLMKQEVQAIDDEL